MRWEKAGRNNTNKQDGALKGRRGREASLQHLEESSSRMREGEREKEEEEGKRGEGEMPLLGAGRGTSSESNLPL